MHDNKIHLLKLASALALLAVASKTTIGQDRHSEQGASFGDTTGNYVESFGGTSFADHTPPPPSPEQLEIDAHAWAVTVGAPEIWYLRDADLVGGVAINLYDGDSALPGDAIWFGPWWFPAGATLLVNAGSSWDYMDVPAGTVLVSTSGENIVTLAAPDTEGCRVTCRSGFYACCLKNAEGQYVCRCRRENRPDDDCQSGGIGSTECGLGARLYEAD